MTTQTTELTIKERVLQRKLMTQDEVREALIMGMYFDTKIPQNVLLNAWCYLGGKLHD
jgi:hypothetical protein